MGGARRIRVSIAAVLAAALSTTVVLASASAPAAFAQFNKPPSAIAAVPNGYVFVARDGGVFTGGQAAFYGSLANQPLQGDIVSVATPPSGAGYWMLGSDGGVFALPDGVLPYYGNAINTGHTWVGIASTPSGQGYWLAASDGTVKAFGDAVNHGDASSLPLQGPIVGIAAKHTGSGYWLVGADGGVFAFGDAQFHGNIQPRPQDITGIAGDADDGGYWLISHDGGVFALGNAPFDGSECDPCSAHDWVGIARSHGGNGYWMIATDGTVAAHGDVTDPPPPPPPPTRQQIVDAALAQVGTTGTLDGANPYGPDDKWSALFASSVWRTAGVPIPQNFAYGGDIAAWANGQGQWKPGPDNDPEPGDIAIYGTTSGFDPDGWLPGVARVGIVESVDANGDISTVEGNLPTDDGSQTGGCVKHTVNHSAGGATEAGWPANVVGYASPLPLSAAASVRSQPLVDADGTVHADDWEGRDPHTPPGAPTRVHAIAGAGRATVSFDAPGFDGENPATSDITAYSVITMRSGQPVGSPVSGTASPIVVGQLHNGASYQFRVTATGTFGTSDPSARSNAVVPGFPSISSVTAAGRGATNRALQVMGSRFQPGANATVSGQGVTVDSTTFVNASQLRVVVSVGAHARVGMRSLRITNPDGSHTACSCLAIDVAPVATSVTPDSVARGATGVTLTVRGSGFADGMVARFSESVHVVSVTFVGASRVKLKVDVSASATRGTHTLTLVNPDGGTTSMTGALTVT